MANNQVVLRFEKVSFNYGYNKPILDEVSFSLRQGMKFTLMGQNGAGKSTIFRLITKEIEPESGKISLEPYRIVATAKQVIPPDQTNLTLREFFEKCFDKKIYDIDPRIDKALDAVNLQADHDKIIKEFSGGQQARILLASALIQNPDLLLLDEPTNNLDKNGIAHLTKFLIDYKKTCIVISHDAEFLNAFTHGVLYLDIFTRKIEQYAGNYNDLVAEISARIEKENKKNARLEKEIQAKKDQSNVFANKGGKMRLVAKKMREKAEELEDEVVDVRKEDKTIRSFGIPTQENISGEIINISSFSTIQHGDKDSKIIQHKTKVSLSKNRHLLLTGPNGIGKSTFLESIAKGAAKGAVITEGVKVGYYRQDFSTLNFEDTAYDALYSAMEEPKEERLRSVAAGFLLDETILKTKIGKLSEGQKGLTALAQLVLLQPGLLLLDEPTNHMNFRHLPIIAAALNRYEGAMILVSHATEFVKQIRIDETLDMEK